MKKKYVADLSAVTVSTIEEIRAAFAKQQLSDSIFAAVEHYIIKTKGKLK